MFKQQFLKFLTKIAHFWPYCKSTNTIFLGLNFFSVFCTCKIRWIQKNISLAPKAAILPYGIWFKTSVPGQSNWSETSLAVMGNKLAFWSIFALSSLNIFLKPKIQFGRMPNCCSNVFAAIFNIFKIKQHYLTGVKFSSAINVTSFSNISYCINCE